MEPKTTRQKVVQLLNDNRIASGKTAITRRGPSSPARRILQLRYLANERRVLDFGCGKGADVVALRDAGFDAVGFDPNHAPDGGRTPGTEDAVLCTYVLNTLPTRGERRFVLEGILAALKPGGKAFVTVRRDVKSDGWTSKGTYQCQVDVVAELQGLGLEGLPVVKNSAFETVFFSKPQ